MPKYRITTPEQVHFHYEIAGLMSRAMAWTIDQLLLLALKVAALWAFAWAGLFGMAMALLAIFVIDFGYYLFFEIYWQGQSPGKRLFRLRVMSAHGGRLRFADSFARNLMRPLDSLPVAMLVGGVAAFLDPQRRRLGDMVAETLVIREASQSLPQAILEQQGRVNSFQAAPALRSRILTRVTREERDLILDLTLRRDELEPAMREELFRDAANHFRRRYALPENDYLSDEQTVLNLALVLSGAKPAAA